VPVLKEFLPHRLHGSVAGNFAIDSRTATIGDLGASANAVDDHNEWNEERCWVAELFERGS
jgi:hypothetical protein